MNKRRTRGQQRAFRKQLVAATRDASGPPLVKRDGPETKHHQA